MKLLLLLTMVMTFGLLQVHGSLLEFQKMIEEPTGKNTVLSYAAYGCYCGWGGIGSIKDKTHRCCFTHDCCYGRVQQRGCKPKCQHYKFAYREKQMFCEKALKCRQWWNLKWKVRNTWAVPHCPERNRTKHPAQVCECDKVATLCFVENLNAYNKTYQFYNKKHCETESPTC